MFFSAGARLVYISVAQFLGFKIKLPWDFLLLFLVPNYTTVASIWSLAIYRTSSSKRKCDL